MILIAQPECIKEITMTSYEAVYLLCTEKTSLSIELTKTLMGLKSVNFETLPDKADDITVALKIGLIAGAHGGIEKAVVLINNEKIKKVLEKQGAQLAVKTPARTKKKPAATESMAAPAKEKAETVKAALAKKETAKTTEQTPAPSNAKKTVKSTKVKGPSTFAGILSECGVPVKLHNNVKKAVQDAGESISYEMRLRFNVTPDTKAKEIYDKTVARFNELKKLV